jgi:hypothetical protein
VVGVYDWAREPPPPATNGHPRPRADVGDATAYGRAALERELDTLAAATEGTRNDSLNRAAFSLAQLADAGHLPWGEASAQLSAVASRIGLTEREAGRTIGSAWTASAGKPRSAVPDPDAEPAPPAATVLRAAPDAPDFWGSRPVLEHIRDFARARRVAPWALLGITLARTVTMVPPFAVLPPLIGGVASLNLFVGIVGHSGAGKGGAEAAACDVLDGTADIETVTAGSGEAIAHAYMERRRNPETRQLEAHQHTSRVLVSVAEVDTLGALHARTAATIMPELRKAWMGERLGFHYVDPTKRLPVPAHRYRLCMLVGVQPERAATLLDDAAGGTPQRFVWLPAADPDAPDIAPTGLPAWDWRLPRWPMATSNGHVVLPVCETARRAIDEARLARLRGDSEALDGHALLARLKVATALGLLDQRAGVDEEDWQLAGVIMDVSDQTRAAVVTTLAATEKRRNTARGRAEAERAVMVDEARDEAAVKRVKRVMLRRLDAVGEEGETDGLLRHAVASRDRGYAAEALARLVDDGIVDVDRSGPRGARYRRR